MTNAPIFTPEVFKPILRRAIRSFYNGDFTWVGASSKFPDEIIAKIKKAERDVVIVFNGDPWRYRNELEAFETSKKVFIIHPGHGHDVYKNGMIELSFPDVFFIRPTTTTPFIPLSDDLPYGFSCLNNRVAIHRTLLGCKFLERGLLESMIYTQGLFDYSEFWEKEFPETVPSNYFEFKQMWPYRTIPEEVIDGSSRAGQLVEHPAFYDAYCHIVTETETEEFPYTKNINLPYASEKSFKPFLSRQIPVYLSPRGNLTYLESLGFETMRDFLPDNFDNFNTIDRINAIADIVERGKEYTKEFYFSHVSEIKHNYDLVNSDKVEQLILDSMSEFVKNV